MALIIYNLPNSGAADADYPQGSVLDEQTPGNLDGTQVKADLYNDFSGFFQKLLDEAGTTPSGDPDTVLASQYFESLNNINFKKTLPVGSLIEHYGLNPDTEIYGASAASVSQGTYPLLRGFLPLDLDATPRSLGGSFSGSIRGVGASSSLFLAVGSDREIQTSPDLISWTSRFSSAGSIFTATANNDSDIFIVGGQGGEIYLSANGLSGWAIQATPSTAVVNDIKYNATFGFVAVCSGGEIWTSTDGATWNSQTTPVSTELSALVLTDTLAVAVGASGVILTSTNGTTWAARTASDTSGNFRGVNTNGTVFVAIGTSFTTAPAQTSTDGITWTAATTINAGSYTYLSYGNGIFFANTINSKFTYSYDGDIWVDVATATSGTEGSRYVGDNKFLSASTSTSGIVLQVDSDLITLPVFASLQAGFTQYMKIA